MFKRLFIIAILLIAAPITLISSCQPRHSENQQVTYETAPLSIITQAGQTHQFIVEVAQTPDQLAYGLMFREDIVDDGGMIFLFPDIDHRGFWMKNTLIFLDMVFVDETGRIVKIHSMAQPHDETIIQSDYPAKAVIEFRGGLMAELGVSVNDRIEFKAF